jgi:hypothetical protein
MKARLPRAVLLAVAEVKDMIESLEAAKSVRNLSGRQRQRLQDAHDELIRKSSQPKGGSVELPTSTIVEVLRCASMTQTWLSELLTELSVEKMNE